ncbi:MAG TPA: hypothetical protein VFH88_05050 [Candidatus Krumholzibacteria bacterium]|nr:hypothetical protein [Candidatus Krumholzibacteria bacterium]
MKISFSSAYFLAAAVAAYMLTGLSPAHAQLTTNKHEASPFSIEKGSIDTVGTAESQPPAGPKPALVMAEEALDKHQAADAVKFARLAVEEEPTSGHAWFVLARAQQAAGNTEAAIAAGNRASTFASVRASAFYNLACVYALKGDRDLAFHSLDAAKLAGFADRDQMAKDPDLASLRGDKRFVLPGARNYFTLKLKDGTELPFAVDLPVGFDPAKAYPVLVAPGQGKKIANNWGGLFWGEDTSQRGWIAVESPALLNSDPISTMGQLLAEVARRYKVENNQFHMLAYGPSSGAAFGVAAVMPEKFRSLWLVPGFPVGIKDEGLARLKPMKVCFIVGDADPYWYEESEIAYRKLKSLGVDAYLEVVQGGNHLLPQMFGGEFAERLQNAR